MNLKNVILTSFLSLVCALSFAHISPPISIEKESAAVALLLPDTQAFTFTLTADEVKSLKDQGWKVGSNSYGGYESSAGRVVCITDYHLHGSIRIAVAFDSTGSTTGIRILEASEESYNWIKPLTAGDFLSKLAVTGTVEESEAWSRMTRYYADVVKRAVEKTALLNSVLQSRTK